MSSSEKAVIEIFNYKSEANKLLFDILLARGFLVELNDDQLSLSDNALLKSSKYQSMFDTNIHDGLFLEKLLEVSDLGEVKRNYVIDPNQPISKEKVRRLFKSKHVTGESGYLNYKQRWNQFKFEHGVKIPTSVLDTHVAILVKAFSAAGCNTYSSCEGKTDESCISFVGSYHEKWGGMIIEETTSNLQLEQDWSFQSGSLTVSSNNSLNHVWKELILVGIAIYENRKKFREIKQKIIENPDKFGFNIRD